MTEGGAEVAGRVMLASASARSNHRPARRGRMAGAAVRRNPATLLPSRSSNLARRADRHVNAMAQRGGVVVSAMVGGSRRLQMLRASMIRDGKERSLHRVATIVFAVV